MTERGATRRPAAALPLHTPHSSSAMVALPSRRLPLHFNIFSCPHTCYLVDAAIIDAFAEMPR